MKIPEPKKLPSGRWRVQLMQKGKRVSRTFNTKKEAVYWAAGIKTEEKELDLCPQDMTITQAIDRYIETKRAVLSPATIRGYKGIQSCRIKEIENTKVGKITQESIQKWVGALSKDHSPKTVANAHGLVSSVLKAYRPSFVLNTKLPQAEKKEIRIPTKAELRKIVEGSKGRKYELPILMAIYMGLRESEIAALKWDHIQDDTMLIDTAKVLGEDRTYYEKATKNTSSTRRLHIPAAVKEKLDATPHTTDYVTNLNGHAIYCGLRRICIREGVPQYRFHDLRHVNASAMLEEGIPDTYSRDRMGHSTTYMLKRVYQHTFRDEEKKYDEAIENKIDDILKPE